MGVVGCFQQTLSQKMSKRQKRQNLGRRRRRLLNQLQHPDLFFFVALCARPHPWLPRIKGTRTRYPPFAASAMAKEEQETLRALSRVTRDLPPHQRRRESGRQQDAFVLWRATRLQQVCISKPWRLGFLVSI